MKNALLYVVTAAEKGAEARDAEMMEAAMAGMGTKVRPLESVEKLTLDWWSAQID